MLRIVNIRGVTILILLVLLSGGGLFFLHRFQVKRQIGIYLRQADQAEASQNVSKAVTLLERYLMMQPQDEEIALQVTLRYIRLLDDSARTSSEQTRAYLALEKMLRRYPSQTEIRRRAALRAKKMSRYRDAEELLLQLIGADEHHLKIPDNLKDSQDREQIEQILSKCRDVELLSWLAECEKNLSHPNSAAAIHQLIIDQFPDRFESYRELAQWMRQSNRLEEADKLLLEKMIRKNGDSANAFLVLSNFFSETDRLSKAEETLKTALSKKGDARSEVLFASAKLATLLGKKPEAMQFLKQGMTEYPTQAKFYIFGANLELRRGEPGRKAALALLHQALPLTNDIPWEQWLLAKLLLDAGDRGEAKRLMQVLRTKFGENPTIDYIRGRLLFEEGKLADSIRLFESIKSNPELTKFPDLTYETNLLLASAYRQLNNPERMLASYDLALKAIPDAAFAQHAKADVLGTLGRYSEAIDLLRRLVPKVPTARQSLLRWLIAREMQKAPSERNWSEVQAVFDQFSLEEKKSTEVMLLSWEILQETGKIDDLRQAIDLACSTQPKEVRFWLAKLAFLERQSASDGAAGTQAFEQILSTAEKNLGDRPELRLARTRHELRSADTHGQNAFLSRALENIDHFSSTDQVALLSGLGDDCRKVGNREKAKELFRKAIGLSPQNWNAYFNLLDMAVEQRDDEEIKKLIKVLREIEGESGIGWRLGTIERFFYAAKPSDRQAVNETRQLINELATLRPGWHRTATLLGLLLEMDGDEISALDQYRKAVELGERKPEIVKRTVQLLMKNGNLEEAQQLLDTVMKQAGTGSDFEKMKMELTLAKQQPSSDILDKARESIKADSKDYRDHLWLGQILFASGDTRGAEAPLRQSVALGGQDPNTWATWVVYLVKTNRREEAEGEIKRAELAFKDRPGLISYVSIPYFEALGERQRVEAEYKKLAADNSKDAAVLQNWIAFYFRSGEINKAEEILQTLTQLKEANPSVVRWARRSLALALAVKGDYTSFSKAQSLIESNLNETGLSPSDLTARALILSTRPGMRQSAIKDLEQSFNLHKPAPNEAVLLAQLYEDDGNWDKANTVLEDLMSRPDGKPFYAGFYIRALLRNKKVDQADQQLKKLEAKAPNDAITFDSTVRVRLAQGKKRDAIDLIETQAARAFTERKDPTVFLASSQLLEEAGETTAAESHLQRFIAEMGDKNPQAVLVMIAFLGRQGRIGEALALCEKNWNKVPAGEIAMAAVSSFYYGSPKEEEFSQLESRLAALRQSNPNDTRVPLALADLHSLHGELGRPKAIAIYRELLAQKDSRITPIVLNNLAWLLSQDSDKLNEAMKLIDRAVKEAGRDGSLLDTRGMILLRQGRASEAIDDIAEAAAQVPRANRYMHLALACHRDHKAAQAQQAWNKAISLGLDFGKLPATERPYYAELVDVFKRVQ